MKIFQSFNEFNSQKKTVVTIGTFDGVHIGHKKILEKILDSCKSADLESVILTFYPHPRIVLNENSGIKLLNTIDEKCNLLEKNGIQNLVIQNFDKAFSDLTAEDFVKNVLVDSLNIKKIIIGHDHRFGKNRAANIDDLKLFGKKYSFEVEEISAQEINEVAVSSTKIRNALTNGEIILANQYLGYNFSLSGKVVKGKQLGRTIGFPTANLKIQDNYKIIPKNGVYVVKSFIDNKIVFGIMNIGLKPTFEENDLTIEVHFFDFNADVYDRELTISFLEFIRDEQKFDSIELLKNQIERDRVFAVDFLKKYN